MKPSAWTMALVLAGLGSAALSAATPVPAQPPAASTEAVSGEYRLNPGDTVRIDIYLQPDLSSSVSLDARGQVRLPLVDTVLLAGLTVAEAQKAVEAAYRDQEFLRKPHVSIRIEAHLVQEVTISGQVRAPGRYTLPATGTLSVIDLILKAGGLTDLARGGAVVVTRGLPNGGKQTTSVDATRLLRGQGNPNSPDLLLRAGDVVFVPERIF